MILCSFHPENGTLTMTSFLRDLYVSIPGYSRNRLNAAYAFGGMDLICKTFQENFGVAIDGCVEVDFGQFSQLVDLLGGITIVLRQDEPAHINMEVPGSSLSQGRQHLNGAQALAYSRIRSLDHDGDFSRTTRQRNVLMALLSHCRSASVSQLLRLFREASPMIHTDMGKGQLLSLIRQLAPTLSSMEVRSQHIPAEGTYCHQIIDGMAVLVADMEAARKLLRDSITGS
jgi:LCP family protein required for cell wall assembly